MKYEIKSITTEEDYRAALSLVSHFFENEPEIESEEGRFFESMLQLIEQYEKRCCN